MRDRKLGPVNRGQGLACFLQMETINSVGNGEERNRDEHPSYSLGSKAPLSFVHRAQIQCQMEPEEAPEGDPEELTLLCSPVSF